MLRLLFALALLAFAAPAVADERPWEVCRGAVGPQGPVLAACRPLHGVVDPQGRELWIRSQVAPRAVRPAGPLALHVFGAASSEAWMNGTRLGANGRPAPHAADEVPGRYLASFPIGEATWRPQGNELVVRLSAHHVGMRFVHPVGWIGIDRYPHVWRLDYLAVTFVAAGALAAAAFGFGAIHAMRRTGSSLNLAALAGVAALQAAAESLRSLYNYPYPWHAWRMVAIWLLAGAFALLLVNFAAARFAPQRRWAFLGGAALVAAATYALPGFDIKTGAVLLAGAGVAAVAAGLGAVDRRPGAGLALAYLAAFLAVGLAQPFLLLDLSFFLLAAALVLPLLILEVLRLGRDDRAREAALTRAASRPDRLTVPTGAGVEVVPLRDVVAIVGADDYAELKLRGGRTLLHAARLDHLEANLPERFVRVHRSAIANLDQVRRLARDGQRWRLEMSDGASLPVSRARLAALRGRLEQPPLAVAG